MCFKMCLDRKCGVCQGRAGTFVSATIRVPASELLVGQVGRVDDVLNSIAQQNDKEVINM